MTSNLEQMQSLNANFASTLQMEIFGTARDLLGESISYAKDGEEVSGVVDSVTAQEGVLGVTVGEDFVTLDSITKVTRTAG